MTAIDAGGLHLDDAGGFHLDEESATGHVHGICLKTGPPRRVGVELEWLVRDARDPALPVTAGRIAAAVSAFDAVRGNPGQERRNGEGHDRPELPTSSRPGVLPSGALLTTEPGGQLELSSQPADSLADLVRATSTDLTALRAVLAGDGLELAGIGLDPLRPPHRVLKLPRYAAMEAFFDRGGPWGRQMMCTTASVQVCLDAGEDSDGPASYRQRWELLHAIGPVLVGAFANSPLRAGKPTADYLRFVLSRITLPGSIYLGAISVLPNLFLQIGNSGAVQNLPFGGTAVLIMIGVGLDTVKQIESQLMQRNYEGFLK